jgi:hypothetical protein
VHQLADVLLEVQALDPDASRTRGSVDLQRAVLGEGLLVLADLEVLRHVGVVVVLAREPAGGVHAQADGQRGPHRELHSAPVDHRQHPRHAEADRARLTVGRGAEHRWTAAEHLRARGELRVDLEADDRLVAAHVNSGRRSRQVVACS